MSNTEQIVLVALLPDTMHAHEIHELVTIDEVYYAAGFCDIAGAFARLVCEVGRCGDHAAFADVERAAKDIDDGRLHVLLEALHLDGNW